MLLILAVAGVVEWVAHRAIRRVVGRMRAGVPELLDPIAKVREPARVEARAETVSTVMHSIVNAVVAATALLLILGELNINLGPLIAGAGVVGLAVGFGAQTLVRDMVAGFFVLVEDQYGVGDWVDVGEAVGTVERVTLRSTQLRDTAGTVWHIPNGVVQRVGNTSQRRMKAIVDITVEPNADVPSARAAVSEAAAQLADDPDWSGRVFGPADEQGVFSLTPTGLTLRVVLECAPGAQWAVERELRQRVHRALGDAGIELMVHHTPPPAS